MRYIDVCSGISAPTMAWKPLGWQALCFAEIEAAPRAVLSHHYPDVPLCGDFTTIRGDEYGPVDLLVGGTPCQSFSVAGLRGGLGDDRGNLALEFLRLADRARPRWLVWENVPGVLSSNGGRDFGAILGGMAELGYGFAYRVLDAQFAGVPQRRRRVFVVGYLGDWRRAAAVLFERHSLQGHPAPRREKGPVVAAPTADGVGTCGADDNQGQAGHLIPSDMDGVVNSLTANNGQRNEVADVIRGSIVPWPAEIAPTLNAHFGDKMGLEDQHALNGAGLFVAHSLRAEGFDADAGPEGAGFRTDGQAYTLEARTVPQAVAFAENSRAEVRLCGGDGQTSSQLTTGGGKPGQGMPCVAASAVRRLTPRECERLQGFPDDFTLVPYRNGMMADGPRYKMLGNSMAVPVISWVGQRIQMVEDMCSTVEAAA